MTPLISVIIPVYNGGNYLSEAIDSVLSQTYSNYEIIVVDDGSTDNTQEIIASYGDKIRSYLKPNGGVSSALNQGISMMEGEWFAWLSHDDFWRPDKLEKQVEFLSNHPDVMMCYSGYSNVNFEGSIIAEHLGKWYKYPTNLIKMFDFCYILGITVLVKKECFTSIGIFDTSLRYTQDEDLWMRIMLNYPVGIGMVPESLAYSRIHDSQVGMLASEKCIVEDMAVMTKWLWILDETISSKSHDTHHIIKYLQWKMTYSYLYLRIKMKPWIRNVHVFCINHLPRPVLSLMHRLAGV